MSAWPIIEMLAFGVFLALVYLLAFAMCAVSGKCAREEEAEDARLAGLE